MTTPSSMPPVHPSAGSGFEEHFVQAGSRRKNALFRIALSLLLLFLLALVWWTLHADLQALRGETARRLQQAESSSGGAQTTLKAVQESVKELQAKTSVLESKQAEAQNQQLALEQLYQDLSKNRDEWALAEVEQVLSTAAQQLQLAGNVQGALIALQNADRSLSRSDKPQFIVIRRAIAKDLERLRSVPIPDLTGMALRLDSVIAQIDAIPLLSDEKPVQPVIQPKKTIQRTRPAPAAAPAVKPGMPAPADNGDWLTMLADKWESFLAEMGGELRQLVRVRSVETPDALLLTPSQSYYVRENLKLRLLNARLALLSRNEAAFRNDMVAAQEILGKYFDSRARQTQTAQALLRQVQGSNLSIDMPTLADSLNAVRNYKAKP